MGRFAPSFATLLSTAAGGGLVAALSLLGAFRAFDLPVGDLLLRLGPGADPASAPVAAIVLDDRSLDALGPLPWSRRRLAALVERAFDHGARALAVDLVLADADWTDDPAPGRPRQATRTGTGRSPRRSPAGRWCWPRRSGRTAAGCCRSSPSAAPGGPPTPRARSGRTGWCGRSSPPSSAPGSPCPPWRSPPPG